MTIKQKLWLVGTVMFLLGWLACMASGLSPVGITDTDPTKANNTVWKRIVTRMNADVTWHCSAPLITDRPLIRAAANSKTLDGAIEILDVRQLGASFQINVEEFKLRWDWTFEDNQYALIINEAKDGFYYDFSHTDENGLTTARKKRLYCWEGRGP